MAEYEAAIAGDDALSQQLGVPVAAGWLDFRDALDFWLKLVRADAGLLPWTLYGYFDRTSGEMLGGGGFKGRPTGAAGTVEIGYGLAPAARGRGLATEAAAALATWAYDQPGVGLVMAHTLPTENASTGVLRRAGFAHVGEEVDPDDGLVWRWEIGRPELAAV
ncbi:MAG: GNAT family N-acetyltransferase [Hymenobacteraceae bacterium]|nr:GNAT family N-acetyltransferase [Hymenobacteraceae bacterium]